MASHPGCSASCCTLLLRHEQCCVQELEKIGEEQSLVIAVGYMLRYNPAIETAKALLEEVRSCL